MKETIMSFYNTFAFDKLLETRLIQFPRQEDLEILLEFLEGRETILDLGCGTGYTSEWLARHGKDVIGVEPIEKYINTAKRRVEDSHFSTLDFQIGDMEEYQPQRYFDAIILLWGVINEIPTRESQLEILKKYKNYLNPGGLFYIDTIYIPGESRQPLVIEDTLSGRRLELLNEEFNIRIIRPDNYSHIIKCDTPSGWWNMFNLAGYNSVTMRGYKCPNEIKRLVVAGYLTT